MLTLSDGRSELWQWDTGRKLAVDADCSQVHFSNKIFGRSIDVDVVDGTAEIPDVLLQSDKDLLVWAFVGTAESGYTKIGKGFKVNKRNKPGEYVFTKTEQATLAEVIGRLEDLENKPDAEIPEDEIKEAVKDYLDENPASSSIVVEDYGLPILYLSGDISGMDKDNAVTLNYQYKELGGTCSVKWQGSSSLTYPKKNFTVKFDNAVEMAEGWGAQKKFCTKANFIDYTHARNIVNAKLWGQIVKSRSDGNEKLERLPNGGAVDGFPIVITINGEFQGLYTMNIPKDGWMFGMGSGANEAIVCADNHVPATQFKALATMAGDKADFELEYVSDEDNADWVLASLNRLINAVMNSDGKDLHTTVAQYLDWESAIDYYIFTVMLGGGDMTDKNYLLATYDGVKWFFSAYDMDTTYGIDWDGKKFFSPNATVKIHSYATIHRVMDLILSHKLYELKQRYKALRGGVLSEHNVNTMFYNFMSAIPRQILEEDARRWPTIPSTNVNDVNNIINWYRARCAIIDTEMDTYVVKGIPIGVNLFTYGESNLDYVNKDGSISASGSVAIFADEKYIVRADAGGKSGLIYRNQDFETESSTYTIKATFTPRTSGLTAVKRVLLQCFDADGNMLTNVESPIQGAGYLDFYKGFYIDKESFTVTFPAIVKTFRIGFLSSIEPPTPGEYIHISNIQVIKEK